MIPRQLGRYIRYWYTYRTAVAVLIAFILTGAMFGLYTQQLTCDAHQDGCVANVSVHPEDRFAGQYDPGKPVEGDQRSSEREMSGRVTGVQRAGAGEGN